MVLLNRLATYLDQDIPQKILAEPEGELRWVFGAVLSAPGRSDADIADAIGEGVEAEVGYAEEPLGGLEQVSRGLGDRQRGPELGEPRRQGSPVKVDGWIVLLLILPASGLAIWPIAGRALDRAGGQSYTAPRLAYLRVARPRAGATVIDSDTVTLWRGSSVG